MRRVEGHGWHRRRTVSATQLAESHVAARWSRALAAWGIPQPILDAAVRDPWGFPVAGFAERADRALATPGGVTYECALAALRQDVGSVLDVGAGSGAASLPLTPVATSLTAVDSSEAMLTAFGERAEAIGARFATVLGTWPTVAPQVPCHDVVIAAHVVYNVPALGSFVASLTDHARRRVVVELTPRHPLTWMTPLWRKFHDIDRPATPTVDDFVAVLQDMKVEALTVQPWSKPDARYAPDGSGQQSLRHRAALVTRRLCLPPEREPEVAAELSAMAARERIDVVTVSWAGSCKHQERARA